MRKHILLSGVIVASVALGGLLACGTTEPRNTPGALPTAKGDVEPRLNSSTYVAHGDLLERQGNLEQAAVQYRKALELTPDLPAARNRLGITLNKLGRHAEASAEFREALARTPAVPHLYNNLGFSLYLEGNYPEAERALARAVELQPNFRRAQMNLGLVLARMGRYDEALAAFSVAGSEADAHYNIAIMQAEAGRYVAAAHSLEQALAANPDYTPARQQLKEISRLAAAEEAERAAATEAEAVAAARATPEPPAVEPVVAASTGFEAVADILPPTLSPPPAQTPSGEAGEFDRALREIDTIVAAVSDRSWTVLDAIHAGLLLQMCEDWATALVAPPPSYDESVCRLREFLARLDETK